MWPRRVWLAGLNGEPRLPQPFACVRDNQQMPPRFDVSQVPLQGPSGTQLYGAGPELGPVRASPRSYCLG